jgi:hypothetical protein
MSKVKMKIEDRLEKTDAYLKVASNPGSDQRVIEVQQLIWEWVNYKVTKDT